eukprot:TRINITY_DN262_c0_g1_i1.p1 TRINITY_DN262_c0_g1~~TRINITY_DN262_c0_g1_i1.p1  ORF type:complete len:360 (-),score=83.14 TRINITY_DN262_c0_g1_i1:31-1110(-)
MEETRTNVGSMSLMMPSFLRKLSDPLIKNVAIAGCGGGFDFVHSLNLYPELVRLQKKITIISFSFGDVSQILNSPVVWEQDGVKVKEVSSTSKQDAYYNPELSMVTFLDSKYPTQAPHKIYGCNARQFTVPLLTTFYQSLVDKDGIDAFILFDGGSDSLMSGDEEGLGDPIEDCVSVSAVSLLKNVREKILISVGFGSDRFNGVSDAASLRAVAELTSKGGFLGSVSIEPTSEGFECYQACVKHIYQRQQFRSVLTGLIIESAKGTFGYLSSDNNNNPGLGLNTRVSGKTAFVWPLMSVLFAFDVTVVHKRSRLAVWIASAKTVQEMYNALREGRANLKKQQKLRPVENLPTQQELFGL